MKNAILIVFMGIVSLSAFAQAREETKKERREKERLEANKELVEMVSDSSFVIETRTHYNRYSNANHLPSNNFISVEGDEIIIQTSNPFGIGYNGLGGITLQGNIQTFELKEGKKKQGPTLKINFTNSIIGHGTMFIDLNSQQSTTARLTDNWGNRNTWLGRVYDQDQTMNYEGMSFR